MSNDARHSQRKDFKMFTHSFRNGFIHGYCDKKECIAQIGEKTIHCKSYAHARMTIQKELRNA